MLFRDTETGNIIAEKELYSEWKILFENAETDSTNFRIISETVQIKTEHWKSFE